MDNPIGDAAVTTRASPSRLRRGSAAEGTPSRKELWPPRRHLAGNDVGALLAARQRWLAERGRRRAVKKRTARRIDLAAQLEELGKMGKLRERARDVFQHEEDETHDGEADVCPDPFLVDASAVDDVEPNDDAYIYTRTIGTKDVPQSLDWHRAAACWICDRWKEVKYVWNPKRSDTDCRGAAKKAAHSERLCVACRCGFDKWKPHACEKQGQNHAVWLLVPPGERQNVWALSLDGGIVHTEHAADASCEVLRKGTLQTSLWAGAFDSKDDASKGMIVNVRLVPKGDWEDVQFRRIADAPEVHEEVKEKEPWTWQTSMFAPVYEHSLENAFEKDWELARLDKLAGDDKGAAKSLTKANYGLFRTLFKLYCSQSKALHTLGWNDFTEYVDDADLELKRKADADMIFFAACTTGPKGPLNPKKSLCRFQFLEASMKISFGKWLKTGDVETPVEVVRKLVAQLRPLVPLKDEADDFHDRCWREDVEDAIKHDEHALRRAYKTYSGREDALSKHKLCSFPEFVEFCDFVELVDPAAGFTERDVNVAFLRAAKTPDDELHDQHAPHRKLDFIHWIEALLRIGDKLAEHAKEDAHEGIIQLVQRVAYAFPSAAEKRRRAQLEAEREARELEARANGTHSNPNSNPNSRPGSVEGGGSAPGKGIKGLGALKAAAKLKRGLKKAAGG